MSDMRGRRLRSVATLDETPADLGMLLRQAGRGDESAFAAFYDELSPLVYGVILKVVRDPSISAEVAQDVFVELWRIAARYDSTRGSVRTWASTIAHRRAVDRVRSEQSRRNREEADHQASYQPEIDLVAEDVDRNFARTEVQRALGDLTTMQREAVTLAYFGGNTYREVAVILDVPEGTVKTRIRDGLIKLRDQIGTTL
jgi:RNA polymerase sigma-70 factor, ECF subfamily